MVRRTTKSVQRRRFAGKAELLAAGADASALTYERASQDKKEQGKSVADQRKLNLYDDYFAAPAQMGDHVFARMLTLPDGTAFPGFSFFFLILLIRPESSGISQTLRSAVSMFNRAWMSVTVNINPKAATSARALN